MQARAWVARHFEPTLSWRRLLLLRWLNDGSGMPSFHAEKTVHLNESLCAAAGECPGRERTKIFAHCERVKNLCTVG
jgi:hypothetical protein